MKNETTSAPSAEETIDVAGYVFDNSSNKIALTAIGALRNAGRLGEEAGKLNGAAFVGAVFAQWLITMPWLNSLEFTVEVSLEFDDSGGFYRTFSPHIDHVAGVPGQELPEEVAGDDGKLHAKYFLDFFREDMDDVLYDFYSVLRTEHQTGDLKVSINRADVEHLLAGEKTINGLEVFKQIKFDGERETLTLQTSKEGSQPLELTLYSSDELLWAIGQNPRLREDFREILTLLKSVSTLDASNIDQLTQEGGLRDQALWALEYLPRSWCAPELQG